MLPPSASASLAPSCRNCCAGRTWHLCPGKTARAIAEFLSRGGIVVFAASMPISPARKLQNARGTCDFRAHTHLGIVLGRPGLRAEGVGDGRVIGHHDVVEVVIVVHGPDLDGGRVDLAQVGERRLVIVVSRVGDLGRLPDALQRSQEQMSG